MTSAELTGISPAFPYAVILCFPSALLAGGMRLGVDLHDFGKTGITVRKLRPELVKSVSLPHRIRLTEREKSKGFQGIKYDLWRGCQI